MSLKGSKIKKNKIAGLDPIKEKQCVKQILKSTEKHFSCFFFLHKLSRHGIFCDMKYSVGGIM